MVILSNRQWEKVSNQLEEIRDIKNTVNQIFFHLNSFHIEYNIDQIKRLNKEIRDNCVGMDELVKKLNREDVDEEENIVK